MLGPVPAAVVKLAACVSTLFAMLTCLLGSGRGLLSTITHGALPRAFARIHPRRSTPTVGTVLFGALTSATVVALELASPRFQGDAVLSVGLLIACHSRCHRVRLRPALPPTPAHRSARPAARRRATAARRPDDARRLIRSAHGRVAPGCGSRTTVVRPAAATIDFTEDRICRRPTPGPTSSTSSTPPTRPAPADARSSAPRGSSTDPVHAGPVRAPGRLDETTERRPARPARPTSGTTPCCYPQRTAGAGRPDMLHRTPDRPPDSSRYPSNGPGRRRPRTGPPRCPAPACGHRRCWP
ncbi:amino acid permease [Kitasatospora griseola]|uniref:amino acid permease n=1 Tax=Kitasatospora griseola TaxID=2064 RepID=UPI0039922CAA